MKINLADQLKKTDKDDVEVIQTVQKLLDTHDQEKRNVLKGLGITREIDHYSDQMSEHLIKRNLKSTHGDGIIHIDDIKEACVKYNLRFLPSDKYAGKTDSQLADVVNRYCKEKNIYPAPGYFSILAPPELFQLQKIKGTTWMAALRDTLKDPILFHNLGDNHYKIVHKWGNDFTFIRRIKAYPFQSKWTMLFSLTPIVIATLFTLISLFTHIYAAGFAAIFFLSIGISMFYSFGGRYSTAAENMMFYTIHNWDTDKKI